MPTGKTFFKIAQNFLDFLKQIQTDIVQLFLVSFVPRRIRFRARVCEHVHDQKRSERWGTVAQELAESKGQCLRVREVSVMMCWCLLTQGNLLASHVCQILDIDSRPACK